MDKQVSFWTTLADRFAEEGDNRAKGTLSVLKLTIFKAFENTFASKVERAVTAGLISFALDEDNNGNASNQVKLAQDIFLIVAKDCPTDDICRLVK